VDQPARRGGRGGSDPGSVARGRVLAPPSGSRGARASGGGARRLGAGAPPGGRRAPPDFRPVRRLHPPGRAPLRDRLGPDAEQRGGQAPPRAQCPRRGGGWLARPRAGLGGAGAQGLARHPARPAHLRADPLVAPHPAGDLLQPRLRRWRAATRRRYRRGLRPVGRGQTRSGRDRHRRRHPHHDDHALQPRRPDGHQHGGAFVVAPQGRPPLAGRDPARQVRGGDGPLRHHQHNLAGRRGPLAGVRPARHALRLVRDRDPRRGVAGAGGRPVGAVGEARLGRPAQDEPGLGRPPLDPRRHDLRPGRGRTPLPPPPRGGLPSGAPGPRLDRRHCRSARRRRRRLLGGAPARRPLPAARRRGV
ncbi:MAG: hypothetical protein AVDCRST_MAG88-2461, partial [uncultured Thermomicrobiales bacterium]